MAKKKIKLTYIPKHTLVAEYVPKPLQQTADSLVDHVGRFLDKVSVRDVIYTISYFSAVYMLYTSVKAIKLNIFEFSLSVVRDVPFVRMVGGIMGQTLWSGLLDFVAPQVIQKLEDEPLDLGLLTSCFVGAYMLLKIDVEDISNAITTITGLAKDVTTGIGVEGFPKTITAITPGSVVIPSQIAPVSTISQIGITPGTVGIPTVTAAPVTTESQSYSSSLMANLAAYFKGKSPTRYDPSSR